MFSTIFLSTLAVEKIGEQGLRQTFMIPFVEKVIKQLQEQFGNDYRKVCVVFPTRRACLIFRKKLAEMESKPVFAPGILGIGDFVSRHISVQVADEIPLLLALFDVYKKHWPEQDFGKFYPWGQMLLNDFEEIDKQLSDPTRIFVNIKELRKIEAAFLPDAESLTWIKEFVSSFDVDKMTSLQSEFAKNWDRLATIYKEFNAVLDSRNLAYEGKAYREIIKNLKEGTFSSKWDHFIFAGFYGFSRAEEEMIKLLDQKKKISLFWDSDNYYISNKKHEAGYYFRKSPLINEKSNWKENNFSTQKKKIEISAIPLQVGQAKYAGELLAGLMKSPDFDIHKTAIILPDENMLFPVLYSIPHGLDPVNVTMGYPLEHSQYVELVKILHDMHKHSRKEKNDGHLFYHRYVHRLLHHPLILGMSKHRIPSDESEHFNYLSASQIQKTYEFGEAGQIFVKINSSKELFDYLLSMFRIIQQNHGTMNEKELHFEDTITGYVASEIGHLCEQLSGYLDQISVETAWHLIKEVVTSMKIPFTGEPVKGLQVMGFLETRALDFETIIIPGLNEGIMPSSGAARSFIPYSLRKGFGLPTFEDQEASFSYHFYRLLHQAKNIFLLYNSEVNKTGGGEPSRYILQIRHELKKFMGDNMELTFKTINTPIVAEKVLPISITKNSRISQLLTSFFKHYEGERPKAFSSSALSTYINCKLQFYFRYVAGIKEKEEIDEKIESNIFGNIFHGALENLYKGCDTIQSTTIDELLTRAETEVENAIKKEYGIAFLQLEGYDILIGEVIKELVKKVLIRDQKETPFKIIDLEGTYEAFLETKLGEARLIGKFDRVDEVLGITRIIDYKTGKVELKNSETDELFTDSAKKALFQLNFYSLIYNKKYPGKNLIAGFYMAKNVGSGILFAGDGQPIEASQIEDFTERLKVLINEITDPLVPFDQTTDTDRCEYCPYKIICHR